MKLSEFLVGVDVLDKPSVDPEIRLISYNLSDASQGVCFFPLSEYGETVAFGRNGIGKNVVGYLRRLKFETIRVKRAVALGASAVVCEHHLPRFFCKKNVAFVRVKSSYKARGIMLCNFYGNPSRQFKLIGITGTNGKTTTATMLHRLFRSMGYKAGLISTVVNKVNDEEIPTDFTTPGANVLNDLFRKMVDVGCEYVFMEVSAQGVEQERIGGLQFYGGIFSNFTQDHLDDFVTMDRYFAAKKHFFDELPATAFVLTNIDDAKGLQIVQNTSAKVKTYSLEKASDYRCELVDSSFQGLKLNINGRELVSKLVGRFNAYNLTAVYAAAVLCGIPEDEVLNVLGTLDPPDGRFQCVAGKGIVGIVDYAHTPDAVENVMSTIVDVRRPGQRLISVVGCGGDRDMSKRPQMAKIAYQYSDVLVMTSDNPRNEDPEDILDDMAAGIAELSQDKVFRITDRAKAIEAAVNMAKEGDVVLVAGKGHEKYQIINDVTSHFDDVEELRKCLNV